MVEISYARAGDVHVAYRILEGRGSADVVMFAGMFFPMELLAEDRVAARFMEGLASLGRLIVFDKRGVGLSDPFTDWERSAREQWAEDLVAVVEAVGSDRPTVVSWDPMGVARSVAARHPELIGRVVLVNPLHSAKLLARQFGGASQDEAVSGMEKAAFPSRINEVSFREWLAKAGRSGASPANAGRMWQAMLDDAGALTPEGIETPTLVIHRRDCMAPEKSARAVAAAIPGSDFVQLPGADMFPISGDVDDLVAEVARFVTGSVNLPAPERALAAVLFTDLVASTERATGEGDRKWRDLLDAHDAAARRCVDRVGGHVVKYTGDGVLALIPSATCALQVARSIGDALAEQGLEIRAGIHVGDVDQRGDDVSGIVVNVAARIMSQAEAGEILVSESIRRATMGSGFVYDQTRSVELKGVPDVWTLHRWNAPRSSDHKGRER